MRGTLAERFRGRTHAVPERSMPGCASAYLQIGLAHGAAELAQVLVATGKVLRVLVPPLQAAW
jgi:hypothetical protein